MSDSRKIPTLKAAALVNPAEMPTPGTLRAGARRVFVAGARRRVAIHQRTPRLLRRASA